MKIRPMQEGDVNFVLSTWLKSYYDALKYYAYKGAPYPVDDVFFKGHQDKIKELLKTALCDVCVAPDDDTQIIGWIVYDKDTFHYCYVKHVYRRLSANKLKSHATLGQSAYSHHTKYSRYINQGQIYDPYKF